MAQTGSGLLEKVSAREARTTSSWEHSSSALSLMSFSACLRYHHSSTRFNRPFRELRSTNSRFFSSFTPATVPELCRVTTFKSRPRYGMESPLLGSFPSIIGCPLTYFVSLSRIHRSFFLNRSGISFIGSSLFHMGNSIRSLPATR